MLICRILLIEDERMADTALRQERICWLSSIWLSRQPQGLQHYWTVLCEGQVQRSAKRL